MKQGLSLDPELTNLARLAGQLAPGPSLLLQSQDRSEYLTSPSAGHLTSGPQACIANALQTKSPLLFHFIYLNTVCAQECAYAIYVHAVPELLLLKWMCSEALMISIGGTVEGF